MQSGLVYDVVTELVRRGVPYQYVTFDRLEILANVLMVVPAGFLATLAFPRSSWRDWTTYGFLVALGVELAQGFLLPARQASATDVVANTLGLVVGALLVSVPRSLVNRRRASVDVGERRLHTDSGRRAPHSAAARFGLVGLLVVVAVIVLAPSNVAASTYLRDAVDGLARGGVLPLSATFNRLELVANVLLLVPVGVLVTLAFPRPSWRTWTALAFLAALAVEVVQGVVLPARDASAVDVVANTLGLLVGVWVVSVVRRLRHPRRHA